MRAKWLAELVDPESGEPLVLESREVDGEQISSGVLRCAKTGATYPIIAGVPRFVDPIYYAQATSEESRQTQTVRCYGEFWQKAGQPQSASGHTAGEVAAYREVLYAMLGVSDDEAFGRLFQDGTKCLNAGCGVGWSEYLFNANPRANRYAIDFSTSAAIAHERTRALENVFVAQADLHKLPFPAKHFDIIFAGGVLHHTPNPGQAFDALCRHLRPGGLIGIFIYKVKPFLREMADREIKKMTTEMPMAECEAFAAQMSRLGRALQRVEGQVSIDEDVPLLGIRRGTYSVQKFVFDHFLKCYYNNRLGFEYSTHQNVDWYRPKQASHHTREEVSGWYERNGINPRFIDLPGWEHASFFVSGQKTP